MGDGQDLETGEAEPGNLEETIKTAFARYDMIKNILYIKSSISREEFRCTMLKEEFYDNNNEDQFMRRLDEVFANADADKNGELSYEEFKAM